jgi:hypothetical protein
LRQLPSGRCGKVAMTGNCKVRACPWPAVAHHLCRKHLLEAGLVGTCPGCKRQFIQPHPRRPYRCCSRRCRCVMNARSQVKVPRDLGRLRRLYIEERKSVWGIARHLRASGAAVCRALQAVGIPRRPPGTIPAARCCEPGCSRSPLHGRRCRFHFLLRQAAHHARYRAIRCHPERSEGSR